MLYMVFSRFSRSAALMSASSRVVFTAAMFAQRSRVPAFCPAMPPVNSLPRTTPAVVQSATTPPSSFLPTMPPTVSSPMTAPV